ncbi:MAG: amidohydrolase [Deltaproteobacteria bacterium]|nr:amidohydrolase [Deltaproteobacteria bacterium]
MIAIEGGTLITGDGRTVQPLGSLLIEGGLIRDILPPGQEVSGPALKERIDARQKDVFPGLMNNHAHGVTGGPLFASAAPALSEEQVRKNLHRHLLEGTTTVINVDGFALKEEVERARRLSPLRIEMTTINTPLNLEAALQADGEGLSVRHRQNTWERMVSAGATVIGEIGAGATLGGMGQDYLYIPKAIEGLTGRRLTPPEAKALKEAVLGRYIDPGQFAPDKVERVLRNLDLPLTAARAREVVVECVLPSFQLALEGIFEAAEAARKAGLPMIVHNAAASKRAIVDLCRRFGREVTLVLAHSNHATFEVEEALGHAREVREAGGVVDITSGDFYGAGRLFSSPEITFALLGAGVVDVISTDYMGGFHDPILLVLEKAIERGAVSLPGAIALATGNVARVFPQSAGRRGLLEKGRPADLVIAGEGRLSQVDYVLIGGRTVVRGGQVI